MSRTSEDDGVFVYDKETDLKSIPKGITSLRIDKSVKKIPKRAFYSQRSLTSVEYEEGLEVIGDQAFQYCANLRKQQFPSTLIEIGKEAFRDCKLLESVGRLPLSLARINSHAFAACAKLQSFDITTNHMIQLEEGAFWRCSSLTHFRVPRGMTTIPNRLLRGCSSLSGVDIPSTVIKIEANAFGHCRKLTEIDLPEGLERIGTGAFERTGLKHFHCRSTVTMIMPRALSDCEDLESVTLPSELKVIPGLAFANCSKLKDVSIPQSVVGIRERAFQASGLTQLDLSQSKNLVRIGKGAFNRCSNLKNVILPRTGRLQEIEELSFCDCHSLTHLWVPPTVESIGQLAFVCCNSLVSVEVPETLNRLPLLGYDALGESDLNGLESESVYKSLVNIYIPPTQELEEMNDPNSDQFVEYMKLGEAESSYPELMDKLRRRFDSLPLHRVCYFQSYHSLQENIETIKSILGTTDGGPTSVLEQTDFLGMTPFHILALSQFPSLELFQELVSMSTSSEDIILCREDIFECTPLDYLCKNIYSPQAVSVTKSLLSQILEPRISFLGLKSWKQDIQSDLDEVLQMAPISLEEEAWMSTLATYVGLLVHKCKKLERMEVLSLLELSVWKMKLDEAVTENARESCRVHCGSDIVLENMLPFLGGTDSTL